MRDDNEYLMASFHCKLSQPGTDLPHFWEHVVGSDHAPMALRADWQAQLRRCHEELGFRYVRFHGLLSDDMGTVIRHDEKLLYSFFNADQIIDFLRSIDMRPFVELSFMPKALASGDKTVFRYAANVTPPQDYPTWEQLIDRLIAHWIERYGALEVREWFFEVWNEPNLAAFWTGTQRDYFTLYRHTAKALKAADPALKVGGPATAKNAWLDEFMAFCEQNAVPVDFVSTHHYPTDALGNEGDDTVTQLAESRRSLLRDQARDAQRQARGRPLYYTEWSSSSNPRDPLHDEPYAAAFIVKTIMEARGLVQGYGFWAFSDLFAENYFPSVPFHGGFGLLNLHGIAKPTYRAMQLLHALGDRILSVDGAHATVDCWVVRGATSLTVLISNHALPRHDISKEPVHIALLDARAPHSAYVQRIDDAHANAKAKWLEMGSPEVLNADQLRQLNAASALASEPQAWTVEADTLHLDVELPPHGVAAIILEWT